MSVKEILIRIKPIKSKKDYKYYLKLIDELIDCKEGSKEEELLELIAIIVEDYEDKHYPIEAPDPIDAIKIRMEELGLKNKDVAIYFGSEGRASEILSRKKNLSLNMIKKIHKGLGISAETLIGV